jgi:AraC family transcriptional regulator of adaptative response/methylated-DNA-[protein]-cysteine methyltransferase
MNSKTNFEYAGSHNYSNELKWLAVTSSDKSADGVFYYSVQSTGVYCKPSCSSRKPLRKNVDFHNTASEAELSGFRACKRCRPNERDSDNAQ